MVVVKGVPVRNLGRDLELIAYAQKDTDFLTLRETHTVLQHRQRQPGSLTTSLATTPRVLVLAENS